MIGQKAPLRLNEIWAIRVRLDLALFNMPIDSKLRARDLVQSERIAFVMGDGRQVWIDFIAAGHSVRVLETFEAEDAHSAEQQRQGW